MAACIRRLTACPPLASDAWPVAGENRPIDVFRDDHVTTERQLAYRELVEILHDAKAGPCSDCGITYPIHVMQLDHRPGTRKAFGVSSVLWGKVDAGRDAAIAQHGSAKAALLLEIAKCDLVCANCHAERTFSRHTMPRVAWCRHYDVEGK